MTKYSKSPEMFAKGALMACRKMKTNVAKPVSAKQGKLHQIKCIEETFRLFVPVLLYWYIS